MKRFLNIIFTAAALALMIFTKAAVLYTQPAPGQQIRTMCMNRCLPVRKSNRRAVQGQGDWYIILSGQFCMLHILPGRPCHA